MPYGSGASSFVTPRASRHLGVGSGLERVDGVDRGRVLLRFLLGLLGLRRGGRRIERRASDLLRLQTRNECGDDVPADDPPPEGAPLELRVDLLLDLPMRLVG